MTVDVKTETRVGELRLESIDYRCDDEKKKLFS